MENIAILKKQDQIPVTETLEALQIEEVQRNFADGIENFDLLDGINNVVFLFSGGKDATFGLELLGNYVRSKKLDINLMALMINYPLHVYFDENGEMRDSYRKSLEYWESKDLTFHIIKPSHEDLPDSAKTECPLCKKVRMDAVQKVLAEVVESNERTAIVTGYTLYDAHAYMQEFTVLTDYTYEIEQIENPAIRNKVLNYLHKMRIKENLPNGLSIIRPLLKFKENTIRAYLSSRNIPFVDVPCKAADFKPKRLLFKTLNEMTNELAITYDGLLMFLEKHKVNFPENFRDISTQSYFSDC